MDEWLENPACQPPCLDNITPGITHKDVVVGNLMRHPGIDRVEQYPGSAFENRFYLYISECKDSSIGSIELDMNTNLIDNIYLQSWRCGQKIQLTDFISAFGEPDYVYAYRFSGWGRTCGADLIYIDKGMWLQLIEPIGIFEKHLVASADSNIRQVFLFEPQANLEQTIAHQSQINSQVFPKKDQIIPWDGYKKYECLGLESE